MPADDIREQLNKQEAMLQAIAKDVHIIKRRLLYAAIMSYIKVALILIPLIIAIIYLPPLLQNVFAQYATVLDLTGSGGGTPDANQIQSILKTLQR
jgi:hypothetical protein